MPPSGPTGLRLAPGETPHCTPRPGRAPPASPQTRCGPRAGLAADLRAGASLCPRARPGPRVPNQTSVPDVCFRPDRNAKQDPNKDTDAGETPAGLSHGKCQLPQGRARELEGLSYLEGSHRRARCAVRCAGSSHTRWRERQWPGREGHSQGAGARPGRGAVPVSGGQEPHAGTVEGSFHSGADAHKASRILSLDDCQRAGRPGQAGVCLCPLRPGQ